MDLVIKENGAWIHEGRAIKRRELIALFASILSVDRDGHYYLVSPQERVRIKVEKFPFLVQEMDIVGEGCYQSIYFTTNVGERFKVTSDNYMVIPFSATIKEPVVHVRNGLLAGICRSVYYRLADLIVVENSQIGVYSSGEFFVISDQ